MYADMYSLYTSRYSFNYHYSACIFFFLFLSRYPFYQMHVLLNHMDKKGIC